MSAVKKINNKTKRKFRKVLAVLLSIVLAAGLALTYSSDSVLRAEELSPDEVKEEIVETKKEEPEEVKQEEKKEEPAPAPQKQESNDAGNSGSSVNAGNTGNAENQASSQDSGPSGSRTQETPAPQVNDQANSGASDSGANVSEGEISLDAEGKGEEDTDDEEEYWVVTFYDRDAQVHKKVEVKKGDAIGGDVPPAIPREDYYAYWAVGKIVAGGQGNETKVTGQRITGSFKPSSDTVIVPDYEEITHKVTFHESKGGPVIEGGVRTAGPDTSYFLNDIPDVPEKEGAKGKWVYSGGDFSNKVSISKDTSVWAVYDQTMFTVEFMSDGKSYTKETYYSGDVLVLPADPVVKGKSFIGWFAGDTQYTGGEAVTSDLTITAKFSDKCTVSFVSESEDGDKEHARFYRDKGETIGTLPQEPFSSGMKFTGWQDSETGEEITADTVVNGNITAVAKFSNLDVYEITAEYYYINDRGNEVVFNTDFMEADESELPYTLTAPATIQTKASEVKGGPAYYPETPEVTLKKSDFTDGKATVRIKYVQYTATYDFVYLLKNLDGNGYTEIERTRGVQGVLNSYVTPTVKAYDYYTLEEAEGAEITRASGQELRVLYKRKNVQLTYETNGGSYVSSTSAPYGTTVSLPGTNPEREGYKFGGWYSDAGLTQKVTGSVKLNGNTTLYAKWTGDTVKYTVVYMFEKYDDNGTASSYVYDNSKTASATVGSTVSASSAASITKAGWEPDTAKNASSSAVIAADGSSVLKVYYKLKSYTFLFNAGKSGSYNVTADLTGLGVSGTGQLDYTLTVKLGQDVSSVWPSNATGTYKKGGSWFSSGSTVTVAFNGWLNSSENVRYVTKRTTVTEDMLPKSGTSITYTAQWTTSASTYTVHYWLQNADDDGYTDSKVYSQTYTSSSGNLSAKDITGYTYDHGNSGASGVTEYNFYYNRDTYKIDYYYGSDLLDTKENVRFSANINKDSFNWTPSTADCDVDNDYTFEGWYSDSGLTAEYAFDKMPASNLVLYAKWAAPKYSVSFVDGKDTSSMLAETQTVEKYKKAEKPGNPEKAGYSFDGWYTEAEGGDLFDWNTQIKKDTTVYAHWAKKNISYIVRYLDEEGAPVASDKEVTNPNLESGQEITETAIAVAGYRPREVSQTITLADEDNLITFVYTSKSESTAYTVRYIINNEEYAGDIAVASEKTVEDVPGNTSSVVEHAASVDYDALYAAHPELEGIEFHPDSSSKTLVLTSEEAQNILTFYYSGYKHADIKLHFVDMAGNSIAGDDVQRCKIGETFNLARTPIDGWELYKVVEGDSLGGAEASSQYRVTEKTTKSGLEFTLFYQKKATVTALSARKQYDGKALTLPEAGSRVEGLLEGHSLESVEYDYSDADQENGRLDAGTTVVTPKNAVISGPSVDNYYKIRYVSGTLEVTKINVTVRIEPDRWTGAQYSGELYKAGFTNPLKKKTDYVLISHEGYSEKYLDKIWDALKGKATYDESAIGLKYYGIAEKDAGDYTYSLDLTAADLPKDDNYSVALYVRPGRLQILAKNITVSTEGASKCYDGKALKEKGAEINGLADADKDKVKITGTGSQTEVGTSENTYEIDWGGVKEKNYRIVNEALGVLTVTPGSIILTAPSASKTYDGKALKADGTGDSKVSVSGLPDGFTIEATASGSQKDAGSSANVVNDDYVIKNAKGEDVTSRFTLTKKIDGILTVNKAPLMITTGSGSKAYDGKALTVKDTEVEGLVKGETLTVTADGAQTEVGTSFNTYSIEWGTAKAENYNLTDNKGKLTVTDSDAEVVLTAPSASKIYDGKALKADGTGDNKVVASGLPEGFTVEATASGSQTNAGSSRNVVDPGFVIRNANGEDRTSRFKNIATVDGTLTVNKAPLVITTGSGSKAYDGTALTVKDADVEGLVNEETVSVKADGSQTEVGQTYNTYRIDWKTADPDNYQITENLGKLAVTENGAAVTLTAASGAKTYDGKALTKKSVSASGLPEGFTVEATASGSQTDAGTSLNVVNDQYVIRNAEGLDRTKNFTNVNKVDGTLTVNKATLTITTGSASKEYDGEELTADKAVVKGFVNDETAEVTATGSQTEAGTSDNTYSIKWDAAKPGNYEINETLGTLAVTENTSEVTLAAASAEKEYDGKELSDHTVTADGLPDGFTVAATAAGSQTDAGESENKVEDGYAILNKDGEDKTANFAHITKKDGTLKVTPKAVTVHTGSAEKAYDGTALTNEETSIEGLVTGESVAITATGSVTEVGSKENTCDISWDGAKEDNYKVTRELGTLTVTENDAEIILTAPSASKVYDGKALKADGTDEGNKVIVSGLPEGFTVEATASGVRKNAGESKNAIEDGYVIRDAEGKDKTKNFTNVVTEDGTLTVIPKAVTISTGSASKPYDGTDLTSSEVSVEGIVEGETFDIAATGSIKEVGSKENTYEITWAEDGNGFTAKEGNYTVIENLGTLTIADSDVDVTLTAGSASKTYDGTALKNSDVTAAGLPDGFTVEATTTGSRTHAGTAANVVNDGFVIRNADGEDRTANFKNIQKIDGTLTVNPKQVTIRTGSATKEYDGTRLTESSVSVDGIVIGETYGLRADGKITNVGSTTNTYTMEWAGNGSYTARKGNYIVAEDLGTLTITTSSAAVVLTAASGSKVYDGKDLTAPEVTATGLPEGFTVDAEASGSQKDAGTAANTVGSKYVIRDRAGEDRTSSFANVSTADGLLTVTPRPVTIKTGSGTKEYDGTALTSDEAEITGLVDGESASVKATGSQTEVGESDNTYEISWGFLGLGLFIRPENYEIKEELGKLKVAESTSEITLTAASAEKKYDGKELTDAGVTAEGLPEGFTVKATAAGSQTEAGSSANTVNSGYLILNADGENRTSSFSNVKKVDGTLTVNKRKVTLTSASDEKTYDGAALTNGEVAIGGDGFVDGEGASFKVTGAQREAGSSKNTFTYVLEDGTNENNYEITEKEGDLKVTAVADKVTVTVIEHSGSEKYDGREKTVTGYDVSIDNGLYTGADFTFSGNDSVTGTDAGRYEMKLSPEDFSNISKNFTDVEFVIRDGSLEISKRDVTLRSADDSKEYDGDDLTNDEITVGGDGFANGEGASFIVTGVQKIVGASNNEFTYALNAGTKETNYNISTSFGALTVYGRADNAKYQVSVSAVSGKEKYDGKEHSVSGLVGADEDGTVKVTAGGHEYRITGLTASASGTNAGEYPVNITGDLAVKDEDGNDVTDQFLVDLNPGTLEITKRRVILTSADASKEYDGNALTNDTIEVTGDGFAEGEGASYSVTGSQALTGFCANIFTYLLNEGTEAGNYDIKTVFGQLTITSRDAKYGITLRPASFSDMYDGTDKTAEGFVSLNFMVEGNVYTVEGVSASRTERHAGTYSVTVTGEPVVLDAKGNDVTDQFIVTAETGTLKITKRSVTLTSGNGKKLYDGDALTNDEITVTGDGFAEGEGASYTVAGRQILPGSSENRFTYDLNEGTSADDYYITPVYGMLDVTSRSGEEKYEVTITANSGNAKYDGERHSVSGLVGAAEDGSVAVKADGHTYKVSGLTASAAGTDAGTYPVNIVGTASVTDESGNDVTDQFAVSLVPGSLSISKRAVRLVSASATKEYDGEALTAKEVSVEGDGFAEGEGASYSVTGRQKLVGSSANTFTYTLRSGTKTGNYDITTAEGQLTVTNRDAKYEISVKSNDASYTYDGKEKTASGLEGGNKEGVVTITAGGNTYTIEGLTAEVKATDAGTYTSVVTGTPVVKDADGNDVTDQFAISPIAGTLTITKRSVTLTSPSDEKEYDGKVLRSGKIKVTGDGFAEGEGAEYNVTGERTLPGTSVNTFTYTLNDGTKAENYDITVKTGQLIVYDRDEERKFEVTLEANSGSAKYDGEAHTVEGFRKTTFTIGGVEYKVSGLNAKVTATDAGTYPVAVNGSAIVTDADGNDVTKQFKVKVTGAELTIGKRNVTMTSGSASHAYNGKALTNDEVEVTGDGFIEGEGAAYNVTGSRKLVGISENTFTYTLNEGTKADNYDIKTVFGNLTILNRDAKYEITLKPVSGSAMYDGKEHSVEGFETLEFTFDGSDYTVEGMTAGASATDAGSYTINATGTALVRDESGNDVTDQFSVSSETGKLVIEKRSVFLTSGSSEKTYDGDALTNDEITVTGDGFAKGEGASYDVTGSRLLPGADKNTFTYTLNEGTKADNYSIRRVFGSLTVLNRAGEEKYEVTITAKSGNAKYDGERHSVSGLVGADEDGNVKVTAGGHTYTVSGLTASAFGTNAGTYPVNIVGTASVTDENGNDVTDQFRVHLTSGSLEIAKRTVRMVSASATKEYDGTALTANKVTVEGDGFAKGEGAAYSVTGRQKLVGSSANTFTYALNEGTRSANYDITTAEGQLTVTNRDAKYEISVKSNDASYTYDGKEKTASGLEGQNEEGVVTITAGGNTYTIEGLTAEVKATDAGTYTSVAAGTPVVKDADGNDVTDQFAISPIPGTLTITKRSVTLTSPSDEKEYDGKVLRNDKIKVTGDGFAKDEGAAYNVTGQRTLPGTSVNTFTYTLNAGTKAENYDITVKTGQLIVYDRDEDRKFEITLEANSGSAKYDGEAHTVEGFRKTTFTIGGVEYKVSGITAGVTATDAGTYPVEITGSAVVTDAEGNDVTKQFKVNVTGAELTIAKRSITMTSGSASHAYNGKALTNDEVKVTGDGFIEGEGAEYNVTGSRMLVGVSDNTFTYKLNAGTKAENYDITTVFGSLTILNRDAKYVLTLTPNGDQVLYDSKEHVVSGFASTTVTIEGETYEVSGLTARAAATDAGTYDVSVTGKAIVTDASGNDVTDQFQVTVNDAALVITPRKVTLKSADESREYNGKPLTGTGEVEITGDGFVEGEGVDITPTASRTLVGASVNTFDWSFSEGTKPDNYIVDVEYGLLSIVNRDAQYEIQMHAKSDKVEYDGKEHSVTGFETYEFEIDGSRYTVTEVDSEAIGTEAGVYGTRVYGSAIVTDEEGNDVTDQFAVSYVSGTLTITETRSDNGNENGSFNGIVPDDNNGSNGNGPDNGNTGNAGNNGAGNGNGNEGGSGSEGGNINENEVPYATAPLGYWALFNLIMMILTVLGGLFMLVRRVRNKDDENENKEQAEAAEQKSSADDGQNKKYQKRKLAVVAAVVLAIASVIAFFITEDLTNTMAYVDRYTWIMAAMLIGAVLSIVFGKKKADDDNEPEDHDKTEGVEVPEA